MLFLKVKAYLYPKEKAQIYGSMGFDTCIHPNGTTTQASWMEDMALKPLEVDTCFLNYSFGNGLYDQGFET